MFMKTIGVVGTGIMGSGIVSNYLKAGYEVNIWNRTASKVKKLQSDGAKLLDSPRAVTEASDIIFEVTANDESSREVWTNEDGILKGGDKNKILIASATLSIKWTDELASLCEQQRLTFLDIPLTGGRAAAEGGFLTLLAGGVQTALKTLEPDLSAISSKLFYFGKAGSGMRYKLVLNGMQAAHMAAFGEAMKLAISQGLDPTKVGPALVDRPGGVMTEIAWGAYQKKKAPLTFSVDWITKDLEYAQRMYSGVLPILNDTLAKYHEAQAQKHGDSDWSIILKS
jgi:3-hydroxyisobutyrate dehydrogenase-like beta-hydroxyacid dehydrogenase